MAFLKYRGSTITPGTWSANAFANAPLTNLEIDKNFASLDAQKLDLSGGTITGGLAIGQNLTAEFKDDQVSFVDGADTAKKLAFQLSGIATGTTKTLTIPNNDGTIALTSDIGNGALTISTVAAAATNNTVTLELSGAYSANTSTARTLDLKVGPALTALATLMTSAGAGFIRRGANADTYTIDTTAYLSGTVATTSGGTGITSYTTGDILYASDTNVLSKLVKGADGQVLKLASGFPSWAADNDTVYTLPTATSTIKGGIELFSDTAQSTVANAVSTTASRTYGIQLNADAQGVVNVPWTDTVYTLPSATKTVLGGIKLGDATAQTTEANTVSSTASRTYAIQVNASGEAVVNVPWADTNTTYSAATSTVAGLIELFSDTAQTTAANAVSTIASRTYGIQVNGDGQAVVNVPWVDTNTTYSASTGLTLTGTAFSVSYGTTATTACVGNDSRLSDARAANGGTATNATNATNAYVTQTAATNYDYLLCLAAGVDQNVGLRADGNGGPTYNPLRNGVCLDGFASHVWAYPALQMGRDWSISQDAYAYSFAAGCKASTASAWTGTGNFSKAMRFSLDANYGNFYWYVKPSNTVDTTTAISFRTAMSLDIDGNLITFGGISAGSSLSVAGTSSFAQSVTLPSINAATGTILTITGATSPSTGAPAFAVDILGGQGASSSVASLGGAVNITGGRSGYNSTGSGGGGAVNITGGGGNTLASAGVPGAVNITAGSPMTAGQAGAGVNISATGGNGTSGANANGGNIVIKSGPGTSSGGNSGSVTIAAPGDSGGTRPSVIINVGGTGNGTYIAKFVENGLSVGTASNPAAAGSILAAGDIAAFSDERLKTNITKIDDALNKVQQLNGYTFDRIDIEGSRQTGVIAQEVLKVLPEAVFGTEDSTYSVAYGNMIGLMIEAIKELNAKVEDLQNQLMNK